MYTLIFTKPALYITKHAASDWRELEATYPAYMSSLDGFDLEGLIGYLEHEYPDRMTRTGYPWRAVVEQFAAAPAIETIRV